MMADKLYDVVRCDLGRNLVRRIEIETETEIEEAAGERNPLSLDRAAHGRPQLVCGDFPSGPPQVELTPP